MSIAPCSTAPPFARGVVVFSSTAFKSAFPEFSTIADPVLVLNFGFAEMQLNNTCASTVQNASKRENLLNLLTAHITQLRNGVNGQAAAGVVGRVSYAMEGSVMATVDMGPQVYGQAYYNQTQWGAMYWVATAGYRTFRYIPPVDNGDCGCG